MKIEAIYVYPIKSLRGVSVPTNTLTEHGLPHDRRFMLLRDHGSAAAGNERCYGTRYESLHVGRTALLCLFTTAFVDAATLRVTHHDPSTGAARSLDIPLEPDTAALEQISVSVLRSKTDCYRMPQSDWFSAALGFPAVLAYIGTHRREVLGNLAPNAARRNPVKTQALAAQSTSSWLWSTAWGLVGGSGKDGEENDEDYRTGFADCAPYLVASTMSLDELTRRLDSGVPMDVTKFRPNIVVSGAAEAFEEDFWAQLEVHRHDKNEESPEPAVLHLTTNCVRCPSITVDYDTGEFGTGPGGRALKLLQKDRRVDKGHPYSPVFGRYAFLDRKCREAGGRQEGFAIGVGDEVRVVKRNTEHTKFLWPGIGITKKDDMYPV